MVGDTVSRWEEFLEQYYKERLLQLASTYPEERSLLIEFPDIDKKDPELADALLERPHEILPDLEVSLIEHRQVLDLFYRYLETL